MSLQRALELAAEAEGRAYPKPTIGAVVVADGEIVGEGATETDGRHGEVVALASAGEHARGATLYVTMEPCLHHGTTPPCVDAVLAAGIARVVAGRSIPNPEAGGGLARLREQGIATELVDSFDARRQNEAWRTWVSLGRPFVTYKAAVTLDGRVTVPGERWVSGEASRRLVHELRAASDAVAVGMGTVRLENPRLDAREVEAPRQPRRLAFGSGPLPEGSELELRTGPLDEELRALAGDGVQSLLLEGGPTLARAFLEAGLVDKLLLFVAPALAGDGPFAVPGAHRPAAAHAPDERPGRRGRPARGVPARAVSERRLLVLDLAVKFALIALLLFGAFSGLDRFEGKAMTGRALVYPIATVIVPAVWWLWFRRTRYPYALDILIVLPFLIDTAGNALDLYDSVSWWDDANHLVNWLILVLGFGTVLLRTSLPPAVIFGLALGFGAVTHILWEIGEYFAFIRDNPDEYETAYTDTVGDLALSLTGSFLAAVALAVLARRRSSL